MTDRGASEALELLHTTGSAYLLVSAAFNFLVKSIPALLIFYITSGIVGLGAALMFYERRTDDLARFLSVAAVLGGLGASGWVFYVGLGISGVVGPGWVIFLITAWKLWQKTPKRGLKKRVRLRTITIILILVMTVSLVGAPLLHLLGRLELVAAVAYVMSVVLGVFLLRKK